jgi:hypothetical protein
MTRKHNKGSKPSDADLYRNPMIGGSKGVSMAQVTPEQLEEFAGENTIEGDMENDTNAQGGIDKAEVNDRSLLGRTAPAAPLALCCRDVKRMSSRFACWNESRTCRMRGRWTTSWRVPRPASQDRPGTITPDSPSFQSVPAGSTRRVNTTSKTVRKRLAASHRSTKDQKHGTQRW